MELEPQYRSLKGRVCYRGDQARTEKGNLALYQTMSASPASITAANAIICIWTDERTQDHIRRCCKSIPAESTQFIG